MGVKGRKISGDIAFAASQFTKEKTYWLNKLSGDLVKTSFMQNCKKTSPDHRLEPLTFEFTGEDKTRLMKLSKGSDHALNIIMVAALVLLLNKYSNNDDIIIGTPINKQNTEGELVNSVLALRNQITTNMTFKELLLQVRNTIYEANENQNYPIETLLYHLNIPASADGFPLFDTAILSENIHDIHYLRHVKLNTIFSISRNNGHIQGLFKYNPSSLEKDSAAQIVTHFKHLVNTAIAQPGLKLSAIDLLSGHEKKQILQDFNNTKTGIDTHKTIDELFEQQVEETPGHIALVYEENQLTYEELNQRANLLAEILRGKGVGEGTIVGIMVERSLDMIVGMMGIMKANAAYLPIDPLLPQHRVQYMLEECQVSILLSHAPVFDRCSFSRLLNFKPGKFQLHRTAPRPQVSDIDSLPIPERTTVDYGRYNKYIGHALATNVVSLQATRGCPYNCAFCHKIWPKKHVFRSAENIFSEVLFYYNLGVRRFAFIDDIFNLNTANSKKFFQLILENSLDIQVFFPNGLRGDILTYEYIDLMIKAGTVAINLPYETASPRLQTLIGKKLNLEKYRKNIEYIASQYPHVILEVGIMTGFPTETQEEAWETLNFLKSLKWVHFPYLSILRIFPNTDMEKLALESGISPEAIINSENLAYHELPETLPFEKNFVTRYQADFFNRYFLSKERLLDVLPHQMRILTEEEIVQKYNSYLPVTFTRFDDLLQFLGISRDELDLPGGTGSACISVIDFDPEKWRYHPAVEPSPSAMRVLLLDLSQFFSFESHLIYDVIEPPLGLMYLLTYLKREYGRKINGKILKSRIDFENYARLKELLLEFDPHVIGIRTLTYFKDFFHKTVTLIRQWGIDVPIVAGGPYATSDSTTILQDRNVDLVVLGEGEITFSEVINRMMANQYKLPHEDVLRGIPGLAFAVNRNDRNKEWGREILLLDFFSKESSVVSARNQAQHQPWRNTAYVIFTSGSTGKPKGVAIEHGSIVNTLLWRKRYFQFNQQEVILQIPSYSFDSSVEDIFTPLISGSKLVLINKEHRLDLHYLEKTITRKGVTNFLIVPGFYRLFLDEIHESLKRVKTITVAGDSFTENYLEKHFEMLPHVQLYNEYGPTENSVCTTVYKFKPGDPRVLVGKPIDNVSCYILNKNGKAVPIGIPGELCVSGPGLGRGYLNAVELTAGRFTTNPVEPIERMYKTGDLVKWLPDGNIEFLGRLDHQIKIRGYRVELGEIESQLLKWPNIKEALVIAKEAENGEKHLRAYLVADNRTGETQELNIQQVREYMEKALPEYMVPTYFSCLEKIPLTQNGKIDRKALSDLETGGAANQVIAPATEMGKELVEIWADVLEVDKRIIGINSNFFQLGGHSLKATQVVSRIHKNLNARVSLVEVFQNPTIRGLTKYLKGKIKDTYAAIEPAEKKKYYPLSTSQGRLYVVNRLSVESVSYNVPYAVLLEGKINREKMEGVFMKLIQRHESLRTCFEMIDHEPAQRILADTPFALEYYESGENKAAEILQRFIRPFDLSKAPLLRVGLIKIGEERHIFMVDMHHIVSDAESVLILIKEFAALMQGEKLPPLRLQYKDFSVWYNQMVKSGEIKKQEQYWLKTFAGDIPTLNLPTDYSRLEVQHFEGNHLHRELDEACCIKLNESLKETKTTLYMFLLAVLNVLLSKFSGQEDIIIGSPISGRRHADLEHIFGMFVGQIAIRNQPLSSLTFREFLEQVKENTLKAFENQNYQFDELVSKLGLQGNSARNPLFDVVFAVQNKEIAKKEKAYINTIGDLKFYPYSYEFNTSKTDLRLGVEETNDTIILVLTYAAALFKKERMGKMLDRCIDVLDEVLDHPDIRLEDIQLSHSLASVQSTVYQEAGGEFGF